MHLQRSVPLVLLVASGCPLLLSSPGRAADGEQRATADPARMLPVFKGKLLTGESFSTEKLRGKPHLVVVGFERVHAKDLRSWAQAFKESFPDGTRSDYFQIVALPGQLQLMRGFIQKQMVKNTPEAARERIMTVFAADSLCKQLEIKDRKVVYAFVVDREGRIALREEGPLTEAGLARVKERLAAVGVAPADAPTEVGKQPIAR